MTDEKYFSLNPDNFHEVSDSGKGFLNALKDANRQVEYEKSNFYREIPKKLYEDGQMQIEYLKDLIKEKTFTIENQNEYNIVENIKIDYDHYNSLANGFKSSYGVDTESNLIIYLDIYRNIDQNSINNPNINGNGTIKLTIPLSEKAINIKMDSMEINNKNVITSLDDYYLEDIKYLIIGVISLIVSLYLFIKIVKRLSRLSISPTDYDKTLKKILNQYDRLIVTTSSMPNLEKNNIIKLKEFVELLDAKDNLHKPIFFIEVTPHQKAYFFIQDDDNIILFTLKNIDNK